ncbi:MAG: aldehyde-activating protein, partial [Sedimenticola sp.]|nr:aldehyde-activating protein [Sedimenticola sp.]
DANGKLKVRIKDKANLSEYHQGSGIASFLVCKQCGVLIGGYYESNNQIYAAINSRSVNRDVHFGLDMVSSPKVLTDDEKTQRWRELWFSHVEIEYNSNSLE